MAKTLDANLRESCLGTITPLVEKAVFSFRKPDEKNLVRESTNHFDKKVEGFLEEIVRCEFPEKVRPEDLDALTGEFFSQNYRALRIYIMPMMKWEYSNNNMDEIKKLVGEVADILAMSVDVVFRKYDIMLSKNENKEQISREITGTSGDIRKILDEILPRKEDLSRNARVLDSLKRLSNPNRRNSAKFALASYRLKQEIESRRLDSQKEIENAIGNLIEKYNLNMDILAFIVGIKNTNNQNIILGTRLTGILNQIESAYTIKETSGKTETQEDYRGELRKSFDISANSAFDKKFEADNEQNIVLNSVRDKFLEITAGEKYLRYVLAKSQIIPAMDGLQAEFVSHVQANRVTPGVKKKMQKRFGRVYDALDSEINQENSGQLLDALIAGKRKISEKSTGIKGRLADFVNPVSKSLGYSLRYRRIEFEPGTAGLTPEDALAREKYSEAVLTESFNNSYRFPPVQKSKPDTRQNIRQSIKPNVQTRIQVREIPVSEPEISEPLNVFSVTEILKPEADLSKIDLQDKSNQKGSSMPGVCYRKPKEPAPRLSVFFSEADEQKRQARELREVELSLNRIRLQRKFGFAEANQAEREIIRVLGIYGSGTYHEAEKRHAEKLYGIAA